MSVFLSTCTNQHVLLLTVGICFSIASRKWERNKKSKEIRKTSGDDDEADATRPLVVFDYQGGLVCRTRTEQTYRLFSFSHLLHFASFFHTWSYQKRCKCKMVPDYIFIIGSFYQITKGFLSFLSCLFSSRFFYPFNDLQQRVVGKSGFCGRLVWPAGVAGWCVQQII